MWGIVIGVVGLAWLVVVGVLLWDAARPWWRSKEARRLNSLGPAKGHQEARWHDGDREA